MTSDAPTNLMSLIPAIFSRLKLISLFSSLLFLVACDDPGPGKSRSASKIHLVETVNANYQSISIKRTLTGTLQPHREIRISNQIQGLLLKLPFYPGDQIEEGQILAQLDDALVKAELQKARASLEQAKVDLKRLQDLAPRKLASESEIAQAKTQVDIAAAELKLKQAEFTHTVIKSPISGIVSERMVEPGDVLPLYNHLLSIIDTSSLKAEISLSELLLPSIKIGNTVDITIDALGNEHFQADITRIYPSIDKNTRKGIIEVSLNPVPEGARAGQLCRVNIHTASQSRLMIPYDAIRHDKQGAYVFTVSNDEAIRTSINTGIQQDQFIEVLSGLVDQQPVIIKGLFGLKDKMKIKLAPADLDQSPARP